jgi:hypothetical protein
MHPLDGLTQRDAERLAHLIGVTYSQAHGRAAYEVDGYWDDERSVAAALRTAAQVAYWCPTPDGGRHSPDTPWGT